jgi:hypothetical protein
LQKINSSLSLSLKEIRIEAYSRLLERLGTKVEENNTKMAPTTRVERLVTGAIANYSQVPSHDNSNKGTFSKASAIALAIALAVAFLSLSFTAVYYFYWRHKKPARHFQDELEITEDGLKTKKQEQRKWWKRGSEYTQDSE